MYDRRRRPGILASLAVPVPILVALALCLAAASWRPDRQAASLAREGHRCDDPACSICSAERAWLARNPGRTPTDLIDIAEFGMSPGSRIRVVPRVDDGVYE